jgi:hypothetical protein
MVITSENREAYLRSQSKFYVAGWVANEQSENPQTLPESCKNDLVLVAAHDDYLTGYGDSVANGECITEELYK